MKYRLYVRKPLQHQGRTPDARHETELIFEDTDFGFILEEMMQSHKVRRLSELDIRVEHNGNEWHLSNQDIIQAVTREAEDLVEEMVQALEETERFDARCPECGREITNIRDPELRVCGDCSDKNNNGPRLEKVSE